ncbi:MAG: hypothetical protein J5883_04745 [Clostridiales bacterium]|nr:hypothetical protein [Clostridiales bacterium]
MGKAYEDSLSAKEESVKKLMKGITGEVLPIRGAEDPFYYRNKVHSAFGRDKKGNIISGTYMEGSHKIVMCDGCLIEDKTAQAIVKDLRDLIRSFKLTVYSEKSGTGLIRRALCHRSGRIYDKSYKQLL